MARQEARGVDVDVCPICRGIWLDRGELDALVGGKWKGTSLESWLASSSRPPEFCRACGMTSATSPCPHCGGVVAASCPDDGADMEVVLLLDLEFDRCRQCNGLWIDGDERQAMVSRLREAKAASRGEKTGARKPSAASKLELDTSHLELDDDDESGNQPVECASCHSVVDRRRCVRHRAAWWCERCVVARRVPGIDLPSQSELTLKAAQSWARAKADQEQRKAIVEDVRRARDRPPVVGPRRGRMRPAMRGGDRELIGGWMSRALRKLREALS